MANWCKNLSGKVGTRFRGDEIPLCCACAISVLPEGTLQPITALAALVFGPALSRPHRDSAALRLRYLCPPGGDFATNYSFGSFAACRLFWLLAARKLAFRRPKTKTAQHVVLSCNWLRWGRDSNSWYPYEYGSLANCWFQPLTHPTGDCATDSRANRTAKIQLFSKKEQFFYLCELITLIVQLKKVLI